MEETWLTFDDAAELVRDVYKTSVGHAESIVRTAQKSGEIRAYVPTEEGARLMRFGEPPGAKRDLGPWLSKDDFLNWLERKPLVLAQRPAAETAAPQASQKQIDEMVVRYHRSLPSDAKPSRAGLERFAHDNGLIGHRDELRAADDRLFGRRGEGRQRK